VIANSSQYVTMSNTNVIVGLTSYGTYIKFTSPVYFVSATVSQKFLNFSGASLGSTSNPSANFAVGITGGNASLNAIQNNYAELIVTASATNAIIHYWYGNTLISPPAIAFTSGGAETIIVAANYVSAGSFPSCSGPCVYLDSANDTIFLKAGAFTSPIVDVCFNLTCNGSAGTNFCIIAQQMSATGSSSLLLLSALFIVLAAACVLTAIGMLEGKLDGIMAQVIFIVLLLAVIIIVVEIMFGVTASANNVLLAGFGCG
jgi:hypothetical protein